MNQENGICTSEITECEKSSESTCSTPDLTKASCGQGLGDCTGYCTCGYNTELKGCYLSKASPENTACKCSIESSECTAESVDCMSSDADECKRPDLTLKSCEQGEGNCKGYCVCAYNSELKGCYLQTKAPLSKACRCIKDESNSECKAEVVDCKTSSDPLCSAPDLTKESCEQGQGDCTGYCACEYNSELKGCYLSTAAPTSKACKCTTIEEASKCTAEIVECQTSSDESCTTPDISSKSCSQGNGDCSGYCECSYNSNTYGPNSGGCYVSKPAPKGKACKCILSQDKCSTEVVSCKNPSDSTCTSPDLTDESCKQGQGDCVGHCDCVFSPSKNGCYISSIGAPGEGGKACKCIKNDSKCSSEFVDCTADILDILDKCSSPDITKKSCELGGGDCFGYCACEYNTQARDCFLSIPAPENKACKCIYQGYMLNGDYKEYCDTEVVDCKTPSDLSCTSPDITKESCDQGDGDCYGYCTCNYNSELDGCYLTIPAPINKSCKCILDKANGVCKAEKVDCKDSDDARCKLPDTTSEACAQGQGDCIGYCVCTFNTISKNGCYITVKPPPKTLCSCAVKEGDTSCTSSITKCSYCTKNDLTSASCYSEYSQEYGHVGSQLDGCGGYCSCGYDESRNGCYLSSESPPNTACKCEVNDQQSSNKYCTETMVDCLTASDPACKTPSLSKESCEQGQGNCDGHCECQYNSDHNGCYVSKKAPTKKACKCIKDEANSKCNAFVVSCKSETVDINNNPSYGEFCLTSMISEAYCKEGEGDCTGHCSCACAIGQDCYLTKPAPKNKACWCSFAGVAVITDCANPFDEKCENPDLTYNSCIGAKSFGQGNTNCRGHCRCVYSGAGCKIRPSSIYGSYTAPSGKACKCILEGEKCNSENVECLEPANVRCTRPDYSKDSCLQGQGNCDGYS